MTDIFSIEKEFQTLKKILPLIASSRNKIEKIGNFFETIISQSNPSLIKAYGGELIEEYSTLISQQDFCYTPFRLIDKTKENLEKLSNVVASAELIEVILKAKNYLRQSQEQLSSKMQNKNQTESFGDSDGRSKFFSPKTFVQIPMVEKEKFLSAVHSDYSLVSKLFVDVELTTAKGEDEIEFSHQLTNELIDEIKVAVMASKNSFEKYFRIKIKKYLRVKIRFEDKSIVAGKSFLAGLSLQLFFELMNLFQLRTNYSMTPSAAITANIDETGRLLPVSENSLKSKIEACYYSNINSLIIAKENQIFAEKYLEEIKNDCPIKRDFKLYPTDNLYSILIDRRLVMIHYVPAHYYLAKKIWKRRRFIAAIILLALSLTILKMLYGPIDKNPTNYEFKGNFLIIKNKSGQKLFEKNFGKNCENIFSPMEKAVAFYDLDEDGLNEVFWIDKHSDGNPSVVYCQSYDGKNTLWKKEMTLKLNFPNDPVPVTALATSDVIVDELDGEPGAEAYIFSRLSGYYPSILTKVDARTGKTISYYVHDGNFGQFAILDLDGDGKKEFLISGMNNSLYSGVVMVLDPKKIRGYSPHDERHKLENSIDGEEKIYLTIPRTVVGKKLEHAGVLTSCNLESLDTVRQTIRISVSDLHMNQQIPSPTYYIHFDYSLKPQSVSTSTGYEYWAEFLFKSGELNFLPNHEYLKSTLSGLKAW